MSKKKQTPQAKGWETRRERANAAAKQAHIRSEAARRGWKTRRRQAGATKRKESVRLRKWRKSYQSYLEFRLPKRQREKLEKPSKIELVCKVLFDSDETDPREEHFWANVRYLIGDSVGNQLARIPAQEGVARITLRQVSEDEFTGLQAGTVEPDVLGDDGLVSDEYETEFDVNDFWSIFFDHARALLPMTRGGKSGGSLLVVKLEVCYEVGQVSAD